MRVSGGCLNELDWKATSQAELYWTDCIGLDWAMRDAGWSHGADFGIAFGFLDLERNSAEHDVASSISWRFFSKHVDGMGLFSF